MLFYACRPDGRPFSGASVLIGLFEKVRRTNPFRHRTDSNLIHIPTGCVSNRRRLSHGLKNMPPACFLPSLRSGRPFESHLSRKKGAPKGSFLVREMGLEPTRRNHTHLKRACLPFQHSRKCFHIITAETVFVNCFFNFSQLS